MREPSGALTFLDLLTRPVIVGAIQKQHSDIGESKVRYRSQKCDPGDAVQLILQRDSDVALHFLRSVAGPEGNHVNLHVRNIRVGFNREAVEGYDPADCQQ